MMPRNWWGGQQKCIPHIQRNPDEGLENKRGPAAGFGRKLKDLLWQGVELWKAFHQGEAPNYAEQVQRLDAEVTHHLRHRTLRDDDNQRPLDGIGIHHDRGNLLRFLHQPEVEPTNNRAARALSHVDCSAPLFNDDIMNAKTRPAAVDASSPSRESVQESGSHING